MCGLAGRWNLNGEPISVDALERASLRMALRGPDDAGLWRSDDRSIGFVHRRLAIQDLSKDGHQPMIDPETGLVLVFNGEIYNFWELRDELIACGEQFRSRSDTEVILKAYRRWGTETLTRFRGMFALAIFDPRNETLFLARDRFGVKPLYFTHSDIRVAFASTLTPIALLCPGNLHASKRGIAEMLETGWVFSPGSLLEGVEKLPPAHYALIRKGDCRIERYWSLPERPRQTVDIGEIRDLLHESVRLRMVSDVPVGVFLSGGIDSSLVTAMMMRESGAPVMAYTVGFSETSLDESNVAKEVAARLGCEFNRLDMNGGALIEEALRLLGASDEPLADVAALPTSLLSRYASNDVKVICTGDGGDELFLGYPIHHALHKLGRHKRAAAYLRPMSRMMARWSPSQRLRRLASVAASEDVADQYTCLRAQLATPFEDRWMARQHLAGIRDAETGWLAARMDMRGYLPDALLVKTDAATMAWSLEAREPLLDHVLAETCVTIPYDQMAHKRLLRSLLGELLPREIWERPKHGFNVPIDDWLRAELSDLVESTVSSWRFDDVLSLRSLRDLVDQHRRGDNRHGNLIWTTVVLNEWFNSRAEYLA